jgi:hypothetical protein
MLVDHPNPIRNGIMGGGDRFQLAIDLDFTFIGLIQPEEDIHQGRFASAIFPQKSVNFTFLQIEIDVIVCENARKLFSDINRF